MVTVLVDSLVLFMLLFEADLLGAPPDPPDDVDSDFDPVLDLLLRVGAREGDELAAGAR